MIPIKEVRTYRLRSRPSKVQMRSFALAPRPKSTFLGFFRSLPNILKGKEIRAVVDAVVQAKKR